MFAAKDRPLQDSAVSFRPVTFTAPARISSNPRQHLQNARPLFSYSYGLLLPQLPCFEIHARCPGGGGSLASATRALFIRSCASVQVSTPLFSCACALFCKNTREGVGVSIPKLRIPPYQYTSDAFSSERCRREPARSNLRTELTEPAGKNHATGAGRTCSPRKTRVGCTCSPRKNG
jgi:hypothetical protein